MVPYKLIDLDAIQALLFAYRRGFLTFNELESKGVESVDWVYKGSRYYAIPYAGLCSFMDYHCSDDLSYEFRKWCEANWLGDGLPFKGVDLLYSLAAVKESDLEALISGIEHFSKYYFGK